MEFGILGPLEARDGGRLVLIGGRKQRLLLALLLLDANRAVAAERLIDCLWQDDPPETARTALQLHVLRLRKTLARERGLLVTRPPGYMVALGPDQLDLRRFEALVAQADASFAAGEPAEAEGTLRTALDLWRGQPLADLAEERCLRGPINRLEEMRMAALELRIEAELRLGRHALLVGELEALLADHRLREQLWSQLMLALYRSGRQADALAAYRSARDTLREELGLDPGPALQKLQHAILVHDPALTEEIDQTLRSLIVAAGDDGSLAALVALAEPLCAYSGTELVLVRPVATERELAPAFSAVERLRSGLLSRGVVARGVSFTSRSPGGDVVRLAERLNASLVLLDGQPSLVSGAALREPLSTVLRDAPCDVAVVVARPPDGGPVVVPFGGARHDWAALELGAWIARSQSRTLRLVGARARTRRRDASRALADASLAVQYTLGIAAEPELVTPGLRGMLEAAEAAGIVVAGLSDRWESEGLGELRLALVRDAQASVAVVRRGIRPGGLAPKETGTRYTWSLEQAT